MYHQFIDTYTQYFCILNNEKTFFLEKIQENQINNFHSLLQSHIEICITHPFHLFFNDGMSLEGWEEIDDIKYFKCIGHRHDEPIIWDSRTAVLFCLKFGSIEKYELALNITDFMSALTTLMIEYQNFITKSNNEEDIISINPIFIQNAQKILAETELQINATNLFDFLFG